MFKHTSIFFSSVATSQSIVETLTGFPGKLPFKLEIVEFNSLFYALHACPFLNSKEIFLNTYIHIYIY